MHTCIYYRLSGVWLSLCVSLCVWFWWIRRQYIRKLLTHHHQLIYFHFFFFLADLLSLTGMLVSALRFWLAFCALAWAALEWAAEPGVPVPLPVFFFFSCRSFSSNSRFSRSINVINVLQRRCNSRAVRDFKNQSNRNCGADLYDTNDKCWMKIYGYFVCVCLYLPNSWAQIFVHIFLVEAEFV